MGARGGYIHVCRAGVGMDEDGGIPCGCGHYGTHCQTWAGECVCEHHGMHGTTPAGVDASGRCIYMHLVVCVWMRMRAWCMGVDEGAKHGCGRDSTCVCACTLVGGQADVCMRTGMSLAGACRCGVIQCARWVWVCGVHGGCACG